MDQETAMEWWDYDPETGILTWRKSPANGVKIGQEAGCLFKGDGGKPYRMLRLKGYGRPYAHCVAWLIMTGHWPTPPEEIDHVDGNGLKNKWSNLRLVHGRSEQLQNKRLYSSNTTGATGVYIHKPTGKYCAQIGVNGRRLHLGLFSRLEEAIAAREAASARYKFHANHGQDRPL